MPCIEAVLPLHEGRRRAAIAWFVCGLVLFVVALLLVCNVNAHHDPREVVTTTTTSTVKTIIHTTTTWVRTVWPTVPRTLPQTR